ncbi:MAG: hypothetical protein P3B76_03540 [Gemmatimonadota bacterium]|nr:hypothetical protein [Gemmatimonadota bacterium]MDQ8171737.1 hypothetical protein [Gemmatimonadota bacterium]
MISTVPIVTLPPTVTTALFWSAVVACVIAQLFILRAVFRTLPNLPTSSQVPTPHRLTEIVWVVLPVGGLLAVFVGAWRALPL